MVVMAVVVVVVMAVVVVLMIWRCGDELLFEVNCAPHLPARGRK